MFGVYAYLLPPRAGWLGKIERDLSVTQSIFFLSRVINTDFPVLPVTTLDPLTNLVRLYVSDFITLAQALREDNIHINK